MGSWIKSRYTCVGSKVSIELLKLSKYGKRNYTLKPHTCSCSITTPVCELGRCPYFTCELRISLMVKADRSKMPGLVLQKNRRQNLRITQRLLSSRPADGSITVCLTTKVPIQLQHYILGGAVFLRPFSFCIAGPSLRDMSPLMIPGAGFNLGA